MSYSQFDAQTQQYISENAATEHLLLTPFRLIAKVGKVIMGILLAIAWLVFTLFGWTINVGEYSLENRREAVCDARAYVSICDPYEFKLTHPHRDYELNLGHVVNHDNSINNLDSRTLDDSTYSDAISHGEHFYSDGDPWTEENVSTAKPWISFRDSGFFPRSNDVFRRKSLQMDAALNLGEDAETSLLFAIARVKKVEPVQVNLPDAADLVIREGVMPAGAIGSMGPVTWGVCIKQECAADGSDLNYALFWGDVLWTRPALSEHQQHAVDALKKMNTLPFWLQEFHANGIEDDALIQKEFDQYQHDRAMTGQDFEREVLHGR